MKSIRSNLKSINPTMSTEKVNLLNLSQLQFVTNIFFLQKIEDRAHGSLNNIRKVLVWKFFFYIYFF